MSRERSIGYQPALDGVRAVAVGLVLAFHAGAAWMTGGYVGVSVFFTLSGYLITTLLLVEHDRTGGIRLAAFYTRRMKRLLPASLLCIVGVLCFAAAGRFDYVTSLRRDVMGALLQVFNWVKLGGDASYADLTNATFGRVAPLEHYWSLAIEEQFYWLWPLVMIVLLRRCRSGRSRTAAIGVLAVGAALAAPIIAGVWGPDAAYWATPARAGEILVGAVLAAVLHDRGRRGVDLPAWTRAGAPIGLGVIVWAAVTWPSGSGPAYDGWLPVFALASVALILGLQQPSWARRALSVRPLVYVGTISYGVYLFHWPVFALVTASWLGRGGWVLAGVRLAITFALAVASSWLVEQRIRAWSPAARGRPLMAGALATALLAAVTLVATTQPATVTAEVPQAAQLAPTDGSLAPLSAVTTAPPTTVATTVVATTTAATTTVPAAPALISDVPVPPVSRPVRIVVAGDSTAQHTAAGLGDWAVAHPGVVQVADAAVAGCGFLREGVVPTDGAIDWEGACRHGLEDVLPPMIDELRPDVAVLMVTMRDVEDRNFDGIDGLVTPFDPEFRSRLLAHYEQFAQQLLDRGVPRIAWVLPPNPTAAFPGDQAKMLDPARYEVQFDVIRQVAGEHPGVIGVIDLHGWMRDQGLDHDASLRPDGLHWTPEAGVMVADRYLVGSIVAVALG